MTDILPSPFSERFIHWILRQPNSVLLETTAAQPHARSFALTDPECIVTANRVEEVLAALVTVDEYRRRGYFAAGFVCYEAGAAFEPSLSRRRKFVAPLVWFGIYAEPAVYNHRKACFEKIPSWYGMHAGPKPVRQGRSSSPVPTLAQSISFARYASAIASIHEHIRAGEAYQVNFTFPQSYRGSETPAQLYLRLRQTQPVSYSACITTETRRILSFSPELFFTKRGRTITLKPMKGTSRRGRTLAEDIRLTEALRSSEKERAENLMIVDLLRNDVGRIAKPGSVTVASLFDVEKYETLFQATSTIRAKLRNDVELPDIFRVLFPSGSVTGAPKIRTMNIIHKLEPRARGVYTGSIGYVAPSGDALFSVSIRTIEAPPSVKRFTLGIGSGITIDSDPRREYEECRVKARFVRLQPEVFSLFETMLLVDGNGIRNLRAHLKRMRDSAMYFGFPFPRKEILAGLTSAVRQWSRGNARCRLLLQRDGALEIQVRPLSLAQAPLRISMSEQRVDSTNRMMYHKTTARSVYERELAAAEQKGLFDRIFTNESGQLTEGTRSNIVLELNGELLTPSWECGLLQGTCRARLLRKKIIHEAVLSQSDLRRASRVYVCNALRGLIEVQFVP